MTSSSTNTAFVLVPGSFSPPTFYHKVVPVLLAQGYEAYPTALLSAGEHPEGPATLREDATFIASIITSLASSGRSVVLVMNSYGAFPGTEATKGLSKKEREAKGLKGGITALVYLAAFLPAVGTSLRGSMGENVPESVKNAGDYMTMNCDEDWKTVFSDLPESEARHYVKQMPWHSTVSFSGELTYAGYNDIPSTYLLTERDQIIPPEHQKAMIEAANGDGAQISVVSVKSDHVPMLSHPEAVVKVLIAAANGV